MNPEVDLARLTGWLHEFARVIRTNAQYLTELDAAIGDADHGSNMDRGMKAAVAALAALYPADAFEADLGVQIVAANAHAKDCLRLAAAASQDQAEARRCRHQEQLVRGGGIPASVLTVNLAGEALSRSLVDGIYGAGTVERVLNLYGPSEDTTFSTFVCVPRGERRAPTIGTTVPGRLRSQASATAADVVPS